MFMDVLADAVTKGDGLGIGKMIANSLDKHGADAGEDQHLDRPAEPVRGLPGRESLPLDKRPLQQRRPAIDPAASPATSASASTPSTAPDTSTPASICVPRAGTPILAAAGGVVKRAGERGGYGNAVEIDHGNGVSTLYAHASALSVQPGDTIERRAGAGVGGADRQGHRSPPALRGARAGQADGSKACP